MNEIRSRVCQLSHRLDASDVALQSIKKFNRILRSSEVDVSESISSRAGSIEYGASKLRTALKMQGKVAGCDVGVAECI